MLLDKGYRQLKPALLSLLARCIILCSDGNQSYIKVTVASTGVIHKHLMASDHHRVEDEVVHIQMLNNYVSRWCGWMLKFRGVGTAYLVNYQTWLQTTG
ncbi:hypothetical protein [Aeromonas hydrophila]|uniref:hypothetical protein n=1 Tax=Aeromonas hydrophila TaxID=644 RepID=UPI00280F2BE3|nr:hypothetical protein [Aeromonas hydrophila]HDU8490402.1 hypothetical protein [Aeromonas hydrophila]